MDRARRSAAVRERILDAAETCLRRDGIRRTTAAGVADEAGVSRTLLYRHFPDKATLLAAAVVRLDEAFWAEAQGRVETAGLAANVAGAVLMARASQVGPLAFGLRLREPEAFASVVGTRVNDVIPGMAPFWRDRLARAREVGEVRADLDIDSATEWIMRLVTSLASFPGDTVDVDSIDSLEAQVETYLLPALRSPPSVG